MDEKTSVLICLGAATAANCVSCFEHYLKRAKTLEVRSEEILETADLANKVKNGAHLVMRNGIRTFMGDEKTSDECGCGPVKGSCCQ
jgi:alkylhydroperoxidase/carboxymuconolactone decarboxylase family protein YurZ